MRDLDQPVGEAAVQECGDPMMGGMTPPMGSQTTPPPAHPSMSVNLNAQGMDNIESLMKLMTRVNPDMINQKEPEMPAISPMPSLLPPGPSLGSLGNLDSGPLKMLPDLDKDEPHAEPDADNMGGPSDMDADNKIIKIDLDNDEEGEDDGMGKAQGDLDNDGDHDMDDHDMEKKDGGDKPDEKEKDEAFGNSVAGHGGNSYGDMSAIVRDGNDLNKPKQMSKHSYRQGDNPMAMPESTDLRTQIRNELARRLAEAKGAK